MPFLGGIIPTSGVIERPDLRKLRETGRGRANKADAFKRALDEAELSSAPEVETADPVESVKDNDSEEGQEDRTGHGFHGPLNPANIRPRIDIAG
jgi:hypothetical protein